METGHRPLLPGTERTVRVVNVPAGILGLLHCSELGLSAGAASLQLDLQPRRFHM